MGVSLAMMAVIVLINLVVIGLVMYIGSQHDAHNSIRSVESSKAAQMVSLQVEKAAAQLAMMSKSGEGAAMEAGEAGDDAIAGQLGDEEARARRREAALARKATRAATPVAKSE